MFWGLLSGALFFVPVFGMAMGAGLGALVGKITKNGVDRAFQEQARDMIKPGTSAVFLMVEKVTPDKAVEAMSKFGGTVRTPLGRQGGHRGAAPVARLSWAPNGPQQDFGLFPGRSAGEKTLGTL